MSPDSTITRGSCRACGATIGSWHIDDCKFEMTGLYVTREQCDSVRVYVAVDALLSDQAVDEAARRIAVIVDRDPTNDWPDFRDEARAALTAAVAAWTGGEH